MAHQFVRWLQIFGCILSTEAARYGYNPVTVRRDVDVVAANFPNTNRTILSPAFQSSQLPSGWTQGTSGPTDDATVDSFIASLASNNSWMNYERATFLSEEGRTFPYVYLSTTPGNLTQSSKLRVWLQGGVHGNEPAGDQSMLALLGRMNAEQTWVRSLLERMDILILPRYNLDGVFYFQRTLATNYDPNRDHVKLARQQTRDIKDFFNSFAPHMAVDMHEFGATSRYGQNYVQASDGLFAAAKNLNINPSIRDMAENLFAVNMGESLVANGFRWEPYVTQGQSSTPGILRFDEAGSDAKIGRNAMGLTQTITFLIETRGIFLAEQEFQRRVAASLDMVESILQTAADNAETVYTTIENGIQEFIASREDIIVTDSTEVSNRTFQFVDVRNGSIVRLPIEFASTTPTIANLTRTRPSAYIIPRAWSDLAARLEVMGLEVETLPYAFNGTVETFNITSAELDSSYYEGVVLATIETTPVTRSVNLPLGSFRVRTDQRNAALAFMALEPENIDSFASFNIIPLEVGDEYPIFRVI